MASFEKRDFSGDESPRLTPNIKARNSDLKSIEDKIKEIEEMNLRIRLSAKVGGLSPKPYITEPDAERSASATELFRTAKFGNFEKFTTLRRWLSNNRLEGIIETLLEAGYDDMDQMGMQMQTSLPITMQMVEEAGLRPIGCRMRFLGFLTEETKPQPREKKKKSSSSYCGIAAQSDRSATLVTLKSWLEGIGLSPLYRNFVDAGFDELDHMLVLMNTAYPITDAVLLEIGVNKPGHRTRILAKLREDCVGVRYTRQLNLAEIITLERNDEKVACEMCRLM